MHNDRTFDTFPVRLKGKRKALLILPTDLTPEDAELIRDHLDFIAECSVDHNQPLVGAAANGAEQIFERGGDTLGPQPSNASSGK